MANGPYDYDKTDAGTGPGPGPYAYYQDSPDGFNMGAGVYNGPLSDDPESERKFLYGGMSGGEWVDKKTGKVNHGFSIEGGLYKDGVNGADGSGWDFGLGTANAGVTWNDSTFQIGGGANIAEASATGGDNQDNARLGGSAGEGAALRLHYGDDDHDGTRALGFGVDLGPASFDVKSEMLGECWNMLTDPTTDIPGPI